MIGNYNHVFHIGIHDIDALVWPKRLFLPLFSLESKFIHQIGQKRILVIISILFVIGHNKHICLIGEHDINVWFGMKGFLLPFSLELKFIPQMGQSWILIANSIFFCD